MTASDDQICFSFVINIEKIEIRPLTTFLPTHQPPTQRFTESLIIFEILGNKNVFILQNTNKAGKTYKLYFGVLSKISIGFHKAHTKESVMYIYSKNQDPLNTSFLNPIISIS